MFAEDGTQPLISALSTNDGEMVNRVGSSRKHILDAVDKSVARLGIYIDVLQIHRLDRDTPREEIMRALNDVVESGKVRYIGASSVSLMMHRKIKSGYLHMVDGCMGIPNTSEYRREKRMAQIYFHAELLQFALS